MKKATLRDIASIAGVSVATVSLALNGKAEGRVSPESVHRILKIAKELNYQPDIHAQRLKGMKLPLIGMMIPNIMNPFYSEMTRGVMDAGRELGYQVVLFNAGNELSGEAAAAETFISMQVSGVIICGVCDPGTKEEHILKEIRNAGIYVVMLDRTKWDSNWPRVMVDNYQMGYDCGEYLYRQGHRRISLISAETGLNVVHDREEGFKKAMEDLSQEISRIYRISTHQLAGIGAEQVASNVMEHLDEQSAVAVIPGDLLAIECMRFWKLHNVRIPEDISVISIDNIYMTQVIEPALTTIDQPKYEMGRAAMEMLVDLMQEGKSSAFKKVLRHELIERSTVKKMSF